VVNFVTAIRLAFATLLLAPLIAHAAGLGRLTVNSPIGQPLSAEIEVVSLQAGEEDSLTARLASPAAFKQAGIELSPALLGVQFAIDKRGGRTVIRLSTSQPINEPFLDMLVELQWATGRLVREYTFLLDPPEFRKPAPPPAASPSTQPIPAPQAEPTRPARPVTERPVPASAPAASGKQHEVKKGDTLGAIARQNKYDGVTLNQMLIALYRANQDAFIRGNINLVRAGRILNLPDRDAAAAIDAAEANRLVQSQMADFADYRQKLGAAVATAPAPAARDREVTGRISPKPTAPAPADTKDQLKLSKADPAKPGSAASKAAREDDRVARERALKEAQSRQADLEKNVADLQKLLEMKNQQLAQLEKQAAKPAAPAPKPEPIKEAPKAAAKDAPKEAPKEAPKAAEPPKAAAKDAPKEAPKAAEPAKDAPKEAPKEAPRAAEPAKDAPKEAPKAAAPSKDTGKPAAKPKATTPTKAPVAAEKDFFEEFIEDPIALAGLGGVLLLLVGYGTWAWRKKKKAQSSQFQDSVLGAASGGSVFNAPDAGAAPGATPAGAATPPPPAMADVSQASVSGGSIAAESDEVDPIAEADVYMAYGRDAQAEEILKESLSKDPNRLAVHGKLLEIYANRKDAKNFEQSAVKVKSLTNGAGPEWDKAMALGHSIDPGNGLYGSGGSAEAPAAAAGAAPTLDFDIGGGDAAPAAEAKTEAPALDFDLGSGGPAAKEPADDATMAMNPKDAGGLGLDLDLGSLDTKAPEAPKKVDPDATVAMDFDLNIDLGGTKPEAEAPKAEAPLDLGGLSLDLDPPGSGGGGAADPKWQEVATKLDLAKAYQEMGDKDGARELLNEVVKEGDAAQKGQAQQMLAGL
jgi:pilus assembly protein FimV